MKGDNMKFEITGEMNDRLEMAMHTIWDATFCMYLSARRENISRNEVWDFCVSTNRLFTIDEEAAKYMVDMKKYEPSVYRHFIERVFPDEQYGYR